MKTTIAIVVSVMAFVVIAQDAFSLYMIAKGDYETPWYSTNWIKQPVTNTVLSLRPAREYWTTNAIGSQNWRVREVEFNGKEFWTILEKHPAIER